MFFLHIVSKQQLKINTELFFFGVSLNKIHQNSKHNTDPLHIYSMALENFAVGNFAVGNFTVGNFAIKKFRRKEFSL